jgi:hypothetical protein
MSLDKLSILDAIRNTRQILPFTLKRTKLDAGQGLGVTRSREEVTVSLLEQKKAASEAASKEAIREGVSQGR